MANILDYVHWRGDLSFLQDQFNILDNLIFAKLAYIDFKDAVPDYPSQKKILAKNAMNKVFETHDKKKMVLGLIVPKRIVDLMDLERIPKDLVEFICLIMSTLLKRNPRLSFLQLYSIKMRIPFILPFEVQMIP